MVNKDETPIIIWSWWWDGKDRPAQPPRRLQKTEWLEHLQRIQPAQNLKKREIDRLWADYDFQSRICHVSRA